MTQFTYRKNTDIAHIDLAEPSAQATVVVREVGENFGFPGQILGRFDAGTGELYGLTFQHWSAVRRSLMWRYRTLTVRKALDQIVATIVDFCKEQDHHQHQPALSH